MKVIRYSAFFFFALLTLAVISCQEEAEEFIDETNEEETITLDSILTGRLISASQNNGYLDNIVDGSSCTSLALPITVFANGQEVVVNTVEDYAIIQAIFDELTTDIDTLDIQFPVSVVFEDFNSVQVQNQTALNAIVGACQNNIDDTYICLDFIYPIECFTYNEAVEQTGFVTLTDNADWFAYLNYLNENILIAINYPMGVVIEGSTTIINNNEELNAIFDQSSCDLSGGTIDLAQFQNKLTSGSWFVNIYSEDGVDNSCDYSEFEFVFQTDGVVMATEGSDTREGTWTLDDSSGGLDLQLDFTMVGSNDPFEQLIKVWEVLVSTAEFIQLKHTPGSGGGGSVFDFLYFGRNEITDCASAQAQVLIDALNQGQWGVQSYVDNGNDETGTFSSFSLDFQAGGVVVATSILYTYYGTWNVSGSTDLVMALDFGSQLPFNTFNANWDVVNFTSDLVSLEDTNGGENDTLVFEKL